MSAVNMAEVLSFYKGKKVLVTGHTGFKGAWMCQMLLMAGADVTGYALEAPTDPSLFCLCRVMEHMHSIVGDIRDLARLEKAMSQARPEIVIHMAAQPLVRESYKNPAYTYETNVMGTVNVLESVRITPSVKSVLNVTTDKVYRNREWEWGYREDDELNGFDPYSNSKSCSELVTSSYRQSFLKDLGVAVSAARAGNVIGGGDFAADRIVPDCVRAAEAGRDVIVRNPHSIRPYQHVLEPVSAYLMIARAQYEKGELAGSYNVGPNEENCCTAAKLVELFCREWNRTAKEPLKWTACRGSGPHEAVVLKLDCSRIKSVFGWKPRWDIETAVQKVVGWTQNYFASGDVTACMERQIDEYIRRPYRTI